MSNFEDLVKYRSLLVFRVKEFPEELRSKLLEVWSLFKDELEKLDEKIFAFALALSNGHTPSTDDLNSTFGDLATCACNLATACTNYGQKLEQSVRPRPMLRRVEGAHREQLKQFADYLDYVSTSVEAIKERKPNFIEQTKYLIETVIDKVARHLAEFREYFVHHISFYPIEKKDKMFRRAEYFILMIAAITIFSQVYSCTCAAP